jgi:hypothetical protein
MTVPLQLLRNAILLTESLLQKSVDYTKLVYENVLDGERIGRFTLGGGTLIHDELFVALRLVHDMYGSRFASCAPFERELRLASCTL